LIDFHSLLQTAHISGGGNSESCLPGNSESICCPSLDVFAQVMLSRMADLRKSCFPVVDAPALVHQHQLSASHVCIVVPRIASHVANSSGVSVLQLCFMQSTMTEHLHMVSAYSCHSYQSTCPGGALPSNLFAAWHSLHMWHFITTQLVCALLQTTCASSCQCAPKQACNNVTAYWAMVSILTRSNPIPTTAFCMAGKQVLDTHVAQNYMFPT